MRRNKLKLIQQSKKQAKEEIIPRVAIYCRVSSKKQKDELTIKRQQSVTKKIFERKFEPHQLIVEVNDEAYNFEEIELEREFWKTIVPLISGGEVNTIIVSGDDRIFRGSSAEIRGKVTDLFRRYNITLITSSSETKYAQADTTNRLVHSLLQEMGSVSKLETVKTLHSGRRRRLSEDSEWRLSIVPYGFRLKVKKDGKRKSYVYLVEKEEAKVVRDIYKLYLGKKNTEVLPPQDHAIGSSTIAKVLNSHGISRKDWADAQFEGVSTKLTWDRQIVLRIITNTIYRGELMVAFLPTEKVAGYQGEVTTKTINVSPIVDQKLFEKVNEALAKKRDSYLDSWTSRTTENWLNNYLKCQKCGQGLVGIMSSQQIRYYKCLHSTSKDPHGMVRADLVEEQVINQILKRLDKQLSESELESRWETKKEVGGGNEKSLAANLTKVNKRLDKLADSFVRELISESQYKKMKKEAESEIAELKKALKSSRAQKEHKDRVAGLPVSGKQLKNAILTLLEKSTPESQKIILAYMKQFVSHVEMKPLKLPELSELSEAKLKKFYQEKKITGKQVRDALGWYPKKLIKEWGKSPLKKAVDYSVVVRWL